jgi:tryptophan synthase alpha chain
MSDMTSGEKRIADAFSTAHAQNRAALIVYYTAGFPNLAVARDCFAAAVANGADILEIGLPFSDPVMDGPIIQQANQVVLDAGIRITEQLELVRSLQDLPVPKVVMTYITIADTRGYETFANECAAAGVDGVILPDLPADEADAWCAAAHAAGIAPIFLASSVSTDERLDAITRASRGWVYAAGLLGVTGVNTVSGDVTQALVARVRARTELPVAVGIGVKDRTSAHAVAQYADGVIVGSAVIAAAQNGAVESAAKRVGALVNELAQGMTR